MHDTIATRTPGDTMKQVNSVGSSAALDKPSSMRSHLLATVEKLLTDNGFMLTRVQIITMLNPASIEGPFEHLDNSAPGPMADGGPAFPTSPASGIPLPVQQVGNSLVSVLASRIRLKSQDHRFGCLRIGFVNPLVIPLVSISHRAGI
jgi:hypothetical protein